MKPRMQAVQDRGATMATLVCAGRLVSSALLALMILDVPALASPVGDSKSSDGVWQSIDRNELASQGGQRWVEPSVFSAFRLDKSALDLKLAAAPVELSREAREATEVLAIPMPDGSFARFAIWTSSIMEPSLATAFPEIRTFAGRGLDDPAATIRFDWTLFGFHAMILSPSGRVFIDPYRRGDTVNYIAYYTTDYQKHGEQAHCLVRDDSPLRGAPVPNYFRGVGVETPSFATGTTLRTYRLAVAATGEYTSFHGGTVAAGLAAITTAINRVNGLYENELAIRFILIGGESSIIYTSALFDPYTNTSPSDLLDENQSNLDSVIGTANYDIGHVVGTGGGGLASPGVVCTSGSKARGETGSDAPIGDPFYIDYVAHEIGHQFGGRHTFNSTLGSCNGNRFASTAYEPGSGSTIMAYASLCGLENLQDHSDPFFHTGSYDQIISYAASGGTCSVNLPTGNSPPVVGAGSDYTIPIQTPFTLTATGTDPDSDVLTYAWEEFDIGTPSPPMIDDGSQPLFRSFSPVIARSRTFPRWPDLLAGTSTIGETVATTGRTMTFRVTVRDNRPGGGGVAHDDMQLSTDAGAGPFVVTKPSAGGTWSAGSVQTVTWEVANTSAAPVSAANVKISLSTDGGKTWGFVLRSSTRNSGSATVIVPNAPSSMARLRVSAIGNVFFNISGAFTITPIARESIYYDTTAVAWTGLGDLSGFIASASINDFGELAFRAQFGAGQAVFAVDTDNTLSNLTAFLTGATRVFGPYLQINNNHLVIARDQLAGSPPSSFIRVWDATNPESFRLIERSAIGSFCTGGINGGRACTTVGDCPPLVCCLLGVCSGSPCAPPICSTSPGYDAVVNPTISNLDQVAYTGFKGVANYLITEGPAGDASTSTPDGVFRPMIADDGTIVVKAGTATNSPIATYRADLTSNQNVSGAGFIQTASLPGISDDGDVVAFAADKGGTLKQGIYVAARVGGVYSAPILVAGEAISDLGKGPARESIVFSDISMTDRVGVTHLSRGAAGIEGDTTIVTFIATPSNGAFVPIAGEPPQFSAARGIWAVRIDFLSPSEIAPPLGPLPILQIGDSIKANEITETVTGLFVHDPVSLVPYNEDSSPRAAMDRWDHQVGFVASTATRSIAMRATHVRPEVDPVLRQADPKWASSRYGPAQVDDIIGRFSSSDPLKLALLGARTCDIKLRHKGCALTSYAMILNTIYRNDSPNWTPLSLHDAVKADIDYCDEGETVRCVIGSPSSSGCWIARFTDVNVSPGMIEALYADGDEKLQDLSIGKSAPDYKRRIVRALDFGLPIKLSVHGGLHYVIATSVEGWDSDTNSPIVNILDPGNSDSLHNAPFSLGDPDLAFESAMVMWKNSGLHTTALSAERISGSVDGFVLSHAHSRGPVHFVIQNDAGERLGYDPISNQRYFEIPASAYESEIPLGSPDDMPAPGELALLEKRAPRRATFPSAIDEAYVLTVVGTDDGPFSITFTGDENGNPLSSWRVSGTIAANQVITYRVQLNSPHPGVGIQAFVPPHGPVGTAVSISGIGFTGATGVQFGSAPAAFAVVSDSEISALVPDSASTGPLTVTGASASASSTSDFVVDGGLPCSYALSSGGQSFPAEGGTGSVALTSGTGCLWRAASSVPWIRMSSPSFGSGSAVLSFSVAPNASQAPLSADLNIGGVDHQIDVAQCAIDPSGIGDSLRVTKELGSTQVSWDDGGTGESVSLYRGWRTPGTPWAYGQYCVAQGLTGTTSTDDLIPRVGTAFYYLLSRPACGQELLGRDGEGVPIPNSDACPSVGADIDEDGFEEAIDSCPGVSNPGQANSDGDVHGDDCDNCPDVANEHQVDLDGDGLGDDCDLDLDGDGVPDRFSKTSQPCAGGDTLGCDDNCVDRSNPDQRDTDDDGVGDPCDNCPTEPNPDQRDGDENSIGDACEALGSVGLAERRPRLNP